MRTSDPDDPPTYREIGRAVDVGTNGVGARWREYQDGDHEWYDADGDD